MVFRQTFWAVLALLLTATSVAAEQRLMSAAPPGSAYTQFLADGILMVDAFRPPPAKEGYNYPDCYCTDSSGHRVELGQQACLTVGRRSVLAVCGMSLNNPAWRFQGEGCPTV